MKSTNGTSPHQKKDLKGFKIYCPIVSTTRKRAFADTRNLTRFGTAAIEKFKPRSVFKYSILSRLGAKKPLLPLVVLFANYRLTAGRATSVAGAVFEIRRVARTKLEFLAIGAVK